jgi:cobalt-zinc-cadmium efflux system outer membrane protein
LDGLELGEENSPLRERNPDCAGGTTTMSGAHHGGRRMMNFLSLAFFVAVPPAYTETLEQITAEALRNNPELQVFEQSVAAAKGGVHTARTLSNPELTVAPGTRHLREGNNSTREFRGEFSLSQLFKFPGKRALEIAIAQRNVELSQIALEGFRFQLAIKVRRAFYDELATEKITQTRQQQVESAKMFVESAKKRAESGYASDFETIKSQADLIAANKALRQAKAQMRAARITLNMLMGRTPLSPLKLSGALDNVQPHGWPSDFLALAMARNPAIRTQTRQAEIAGLNLRSTRFGRRPDFAIGPSIEYLKTEQTYGLSATLALPLWDQKQGAIETATAEQKKALGELEKTRAEVAAEVTTAAANLQSAKEQIALYSPAFLDQLKGLMAQAEQGYAQNSTTLLIYLDAKRTYFETLVDYYESLSKVAETRSELESAVGVPLDLKP